MGHVKTEQLHAVWRMISYTASPEDKPDEQVRFWGENPGGRIVYTPGGHMFVTVHHGGRPRFKGNDPKTATEAEARHCLEHYCTYYGTFKFDEERQMIDHFIDGHVWPIFQKETPEEAAAAGPRAPGDTPPGGPYPRTVRFDGDNLVLGYMVEHTLEDSADAAGSGGGSVVRMEITWVKDETLAAP